MRFEVESANKKRCEAKEGAIESWMVSRSLVVVVRVWRNERFAVDFGF